MRSIPQRNFEKKNRKKPKRERIKNPKQADKAEEGLWVPAR